MSCTGWTLQDHVDELRKKLALKDRDHRAYESYEIAKKHNDEYIIHLRKECKRKRGQLASINEDEKVVGKAFLKRHREHLSLRKPSAPQAISIMDHKVCAKAKLLNALKHKREQKEAEIKDLRMMYKRNENLESEGAAAHEDKEYQQRIRKLENSLDKAKIKIDTSVNIQVNYKQILKTLEKESLAFPERLRTLESTIVEQRMELSELKEIHSDALAGKEMIKSKLTKVEHEVFGAKRQRDKILNAKKKQAEKQQKDMADKTWGRPSILQTIDDSANDPRLQSRIDRDALMKISEYEDSMRSIKDAASISNVEDVLHRVTDQQNTSQRLEEQNRYLEKQIVAMKNRKLKLQKEFEDMKYSGERKAVNNLNLVERMASSLAEEKKKCVALRDVLSRKEMIMGETTTGVESLYHQLLSIKLQLPKRSYAIDGDITDQLGLIEDKLQTLLNLFKLKDSNAVQRALSGVEFQEYMESCLPVENVRIQVQEEEDTCETNELDYNSQDNEETVTRQDIKNRVQQILEKKTRKRGRKRKN